MKLVQKSLVGLLATLAAVSTAGCSNTGHAFNQVTVPLGADSAEFTAATSSGPGSDAAYSCPSTHNVIPSYNWDFPFTTGYYTACTVTASPGQFEIYGLPKDTTIACVFPIVYTSGASSPIQFYRDPSETDVNDPASNIVDYCFTASNSGVTIPSFDRQLNGLIIVAGTDEAAMKECMNGTAAATEVTLDSGADSAWLLCPHYAFGQVS